MQATCVLAPILAPIGHQQHMQVDRYSQQIYVWLGRNCVETRIWPDSKLSTWHLSHNFIEQPSFELEDVYRALSLLARESDYIQAQLYRNSMASKPRDTLRSIKMLYHEAYGYQPAFDRTDFTDELQDNAGILIDTEIVSKPMMRKILKKIKKR